MIERDKLPNVQCQARRTAPAARLREPNASGRERGARLLDRWIARRYRPVLRAGAYVLLVRR